MKAAVFVLAALATTAQAGANIAATLTNKCNIPARYAPAGAAGACAGTVSTGFNVNVVCSAARNNLAAVTAVSPQTTYPVNAANAAALTAGANAAGCTVPAMGIGLGNRANDMITAPAGSTLTGLGALSCGGFVGQFTGGLAATQTQVITASITCNTVAGYYPTATSIEGDAFCTAENVAVAGAGGAPFGAQTSAAATTAAWSASFGRSQTNQVANWISGTDGVTAATTAAFNCVQGCPLAAPLCQNAALHSNVLAWGTFGAALANFAAVPASLQGNSIMTATCMVKPATRVNVACKNAPDTVRVGECTGATNTAAAQTAGAIVWNTAPNCGAVDGAATGYFILPQWVGTLAATAIPGFPAAAVTTAKQYADVANAGSFGGLVDQIDGRRVLQQGQTASTYLATVTGCGTAATRAECVQVALNRARCQGVSFDASARCFSNGVAIACPSHQNGYRCESSSKKGLLGLLGLIGIVPLALLACLLCCCLLLPCLLKRKKTEGDVHFATFDPHAAPVAGSVCAPGTAFAPSIGAVGPYPTAVY